MNPSSKTLVTLLLGVALGAAATALVVSRSPGPDATADSMGGGQGEPRPLYWVAPMDANYRRDQPGKSPMGMDLVPVYADVGGDSGGGAGTIEISPEVVNNLGVRTAVVESRTLPTLIRTVGYVQYDEDRLIHIHPRVEGWIEKLHVKAAGDPVAEGQPLYALYSPQLVNAQEELLLALKRNNERLVQAAQDRLLALQLSPQFISELRRDRQIRQTITFNAPQSGVVDNLNIREGFYVKPGTTLMSIGSLDDVWVEAEVFERQAALVQVGLPVTMTLDYLPAKEWRGTVDYVYPSLDEKTRTLRIRLRFNNEAGTLKPNMFAQVLIEANRGEKALIIPREAVIRTGDQDRVVLALGEGRFKSVAVGLGRVDEQYAEIRQGLNVDDTVVVSAQFLMDSESSKTSDFMRMHRADVVGPETAAPDAHQHHQQPGADHD
jgi:membrane fusion protein, copper/silver efflux system